MYYFLPTRLYTTSIASPPESKLVVPILSHILLLLYPRKARSSSSYGGGGGEKTDEYDLAKALKVAPLASKHGRRIHACVIKFGFCRFAILMTALMNFNLKCGNLEEAIKVFDEMSDRDVVSWTSVVVGYAQRQRYKDSLDSFRKMIASDVVPNGFSFSGALSACSGLEALRQGQQIHCHALTSGELGANVVLQNSLLHMYWRCHRSFDAQSLFNSIKTKSSSSSSSSKDIIAWNEMISGHLQCGQGEEALKLFVSMLSQAAAALKPDNFSYAICAVACSSLASLQQGIQIHACILKTGFHSDLIVTNALIDMYAKCGCVNSSKLVFDATPSADRDSLLWTSVISALGRNGKVKEVLAVFEQMLESNIKPDEVTYLVVLSACSHGGLVQQGWQYFRLMTQDNSIPASQEHYACMVDLLCRSGYLKQALSFIKQMPMKPGISVWSAFLASCTMHANVVLAQFAAQQLLELDPQNLGKFASLSNANASECNWNETEEIRDLMKSNNVKKEPGCSWIELNTGLHVFCATARSHTEINNTLLALNRLMNMCWKECSIE